jgi:phosphate transport system substrate-binding protein
VRRASRAILGAVLCVALATPGAASAGTLRVGGSTGAQPLIQALGQGFKKAGKGAVLGTYAATGSSTGIKNVAAATLDLAGSSRDPSDSDPTGLVFTPIAREHLVVVVHPSNPVCRTGLTAAQVKTVFVEGAGEWGDVGAPGLGAMRVFTRVATSGTQASFSRLFLAGEPPRGEALFSNSAIRSAIGKNKHSISFVTGAYTSTSKQVCGVPIDGVAPSLKNTAAGKYRFWSYQYLVTKGVPSGDAARFVAFARSTAAQRDIVARYGVPVRATLAARTT